MPAIIDCWQGIDDVKIRKISNLAKTTIFRDRKFLQQSLNRANLLLIPYSLIQEQLSH
jgi:hypothetical protein